MTVDADQVQVSHEALLRAWPRLREWIDSDRVALRAHQQLTAAARTWAQEGQDPTCCTGGRALPPPWSSSHGAAWARMRAARRRRPRRHRPPLGSHPGHRPCPGMQHTSARRPHRLDALRPQHPPARPMRVGPSVTRSGSPPVQVVAWKEVGRASAINGWRRLRLVGS
ncbi:hypothetical protein AB0C13_22780 [Streptomyces sp. NPDC049099]|uniref:nSTAND1 domain-containing NTPase n=1 Tax=Streptomyces sp. NPDC049099 TaxID=3155768 RepID=UPI003427BC75